MTVPAPITDHVRQAVSRLVTPFKNRPRFAAWCASVNVGWQELEDMMQAWLVSWDVDTCDLPRLTILGKRVGQTPVGGLETFRRLVKARILVNRSDGTGPTLIRIAKLLFSTDVWYTEGDCEIEIEARAGVSSDVDIGILVSMLRLAKMGGVRLRAIAGIEDSDFLLGLDGAEEIDDHLHGFSDGDADGAGATVGGALAGDW